MLFFRNTTLETVTEYLPENDKNLNIWHDGEKNHHVTCYSSTDEHKQEKGRPLGPRILEEVEPF